MKERPILFQTNMVQAILSGQKNQTRRIVKPQPIDDTALSGCVFSGDQKRAYKNDKFHQRWQERYVELCRYGQPRDILWVRETWASDDDNKTTWYRADGETYNAGLPWRPSLFMPRAAARLFLRITDVRVERLNEISEADAIAEGIEYADFSTYDDGIYMGNNEVRYRNYHHKGWPHNEKSQLMYGSAVESYRTLWETINTTEGKRWADNPWVFVIEFSRIDQP